MWRYFAARVAGTSHAKTGQPCQDRFSCSTELEGWFIAAVADGAGSAVHSARGAELSTTVWVDATTKAISAGATDLVGAVRSSVEAARERVLREAEAMSVSPRELASTLLVLAIGPAGGAAAQIGDGIIAHTDDREEWHFLFWPQRGEYANATRFLVDDDALTALETAHLQPHILELSLMTDGLERLALHYESRTLLNRFFEGMIAPLRAHDAAGEVTELSAKLGVYLASPAIGNLADDDLTLVLASRAAP